MPAMLRHACLALTLVACLLLVLGEFGDLNVLRIGTVDRPDLSQGVGDNHGYALLVIAVVAALMAAAAWRTGLRPPAVAVAVLGAVAVLIVLTVDAPDVDAIGTVGDNYESASARAATGFKLAATGAVLLLFSGVATALAPSLSGRPERPSRA